MTILVMIMNSISGRNKDANTKIKIKQITKMGENSHIPHHRHCSCQG